MYILRRFLSGVLAIAVTSMVFVGFVGTGLAQQNGLNDASSKQSAQNTGDAGTKTAFSDVVSQHPNEAAIAYLKDKGLVKGYDDGTFLPDTTINRAEFMKIIIGAAVADPKGSGCFKDVKNEWFAKYICEAKTRGLVGGYPDGTFQPGQNISIVEASKIIVPAISVKGDGGLIPMNEWKPWYKPFVSAMAEEKAIPVSIDYPEKKITRGEMSEMVWRIKAQVSDRGYKTYASLTDPLPNISSCVELKEKIGLQNYRQNWGIRPLMMKTMALPDAEPESADVSSAPPGDTTAVAPAPVAAPMAPGQESAANNDYSKTNVQVEGVDEADVVKNDGQHIYLIKGVSIRIVKAISQSVGATAGGNEMKEVSRVAVPENNFTPSEMFVDGNRLVVVGNAYDQTTYTSQTVVYVYDITDRANVKQLRRVSFEGSYVSSRRIGGYAYFVMNASPRYEVLNSATDDGSGIIPTFVDSKIGKAMPVVGCSSLRVFPRYDEPNFLVIAGVPLESGEANITRQAYLGSGSTIYSSLDSLYVATQKYEYDETQRYMIWRPPAGKISTILYRFVLKDGLITYKTMGAVPGTLLNQFSMDENGDAFRVATTRGSFWGSPGAEPTNQLLILDKNNLEKKLGEVNDIGKGETIKSVRFMGKRAYVVTFKNTDPFYVIDVADPRAPKILGELKLPGYSDYLHPYDENHIMGFGKDAVDASDFKNLDDGFMPGRENFAWYQGMKLAMFDVTDPTAPKEMFHEIIGDRGTQSELLHDHKALLFSKEKGLLAFPIEIAEIKDKEKAKANPGTYGAVTFRGAVVYSVDLTKGFTLKGKISHADINAVPSTEVNVGSMPYDYNAIIKRILTIGNVLYSVSMKKVEANSLTDMSKQGSVVLEKEPLSGIDYSGGGCVTC